LRSRGWDPLIVTAEWTKKYGKIHLVPADGGTLSTHAHANGFMTEHSPLSFTFLFLAEYTNIMAISTILALVFLGLYSPILVYLFI
jgi:hypothetical protein